MNGYRSSAHSLLPCGDAQDPASGSIPTMAMRGAVGRRRTATRPAQRHGTRPGAHARKCYAALLL
eukprot:2594667-Pleurochrysis_carterae.AAC.1